jgi:cation transport ATPase
VRPLVPPYPARLLATAPLSRDDLAAIPAAIALSRRARRVVLAIAASFIAVLVVWDLVGHLPLPLGVAGHEGSAVIVGLNGLRLLHRSAWRRAVRETSSVVPPVVARDAVP